MTGPSITAAANESQSSLVTALVVCAVLWTMAAGAVFSYKMCVLQWSPKNVVVNRQCGNENSKYVVAFDLRLNGHCLCIVTRHDESLMEESTRILIKHFTSYA